MHSPALNMFSFVLCFLTAVLSLVASTGVDPRPAIGLALGQSYGTAVAQWSNGTIVKLAKIEGGPEYQAFIRQQTYHPSAASPPSLSITPQSLNGLMTFSRVPRDRGIHVLAEMLTSLRIASEGILGMPLPETVVVTLPYMPSWEHDEVDRRSCVEKARKLAVIGPINTENMAPDYLAEVNTVLAANGHRHCQETDCYGPEYSREPGWYSRVFFISLTNKSLYVAFQAGVCFFRSPAGTAKISRISPEFGLDQQHEREGFWHELQDYLVAEAEAYAKMDLPPKSYWVVLAGEAGVDPKLVETAEKLVAHMKKDSLFRDDNLEDGPKVGLLVSKEPAYAAAIGAAFRKRTLIDSTYCEDYFEKEGRPQDRWRVMTDEEDAAFEARLEADRHDEL